MQTILISGFEPFGGKTDNSSQRVIAKLDGVWVSEQTRVKVCCLPVVRRKSARLLLDAVNRYQPSAVIALGEARRDSISLERVAINIDDYSIPDNEQNQPIDEVIVVDAPAAYWSSLPIKRVYRMLKQHDIPVEISNTAGTFVCNHVFFQLQHALQKTSIISGFVHVPVLEALDRKRNMDLSTVVEGVRLMAHLLSQNITERDSLSDS